MTRSRCTSPPSLDAARIALRLRASGSEPRPDAELRLRTVGAAVLYAPLLAALVYLLLTELLYAFGPWPFEIEDPWRLFGFLAASKLAMLVGFVLGVRHAVGVARAVSRHWSVDRLVMIGSLATLVIFLPTVAFRTAGGIGFQEALLAPGKAYEASLGARSGIPLVEYARMSLAPLTVLPLPLLIYYWRHIRLLTRLVAMTAVGSTVVLFILMGTNKALADTLIIGFVCFAAAHVAGMLRFSARGWIVLSTAGLVAIAGFLLFFTAGQATRQGAASFFGYFPELNVHAERGNWMVESLPPLGQVGALGLSLYVTQGYAALDLSLREPFVPCYGVGNSYFLSRQVSRLSGNDYFERCSYPYRIEERYGWDDEVLWSGAYSWLASDITFPGTSLLLGFVGLLFGLAWVGTLQGANPYSVVVFALLCVGIAYLPANNQLLHAGESLFGLMGALILWWTVDRHSGRVDMRRLHWRGS
jgi:hypothetical protein